MKKSFAITILIILFFSIASAQILPENNSLKIDNQILKDPTPKIDEKLDKNLQLPENVQIIMRILFGIKEDITISASILLLAIWAWVLFLLSEILKTIPFFDNNVKRWIGTFSINIIIAITGTYVSIANLFIDFGSYISFLKDWSAGLLFFAVAIIMLFFALFQKLLKKWTEGIEKEKYEELGLKSGYALGYTKAQAEAAAEAEKNLRSSKK